MGMRKKMLDIKDKKLKDDLKANCFLKKLQVFENESNKLQDDI
jgi:hypothetical protein